MEKIQCIPHPSLLHDISDFTVAYPSVLLNFSQDRMVYIKCPKRDDTGQ